MTNFAANNTNASAGNIKICEITPRNGSPTELNAVVTNLSYYENLLSNSITSSFIISDSGSLNKKENSGILDGLPIRGGEKVKLQIEDAQYTRNILNIELYVNRIKNANPTTNKDVFILDLSTLEFINNEKVRVIKRYNESISDNVTRILKEVLKTAKPIDADPTGIPYNFIGNERKPFYVCSWLASRSVPTKGIGGAAGYFFYETSLGYKFKSIDVLNAQPPKKKYVYSNNEQIAEQYDAKILSMTVERDMDLQQNLSLGVYANRTLYFDFFNLEYIPSIYTIGSQEPKLTLIGEDFTYVAPEFKESPTRFMSRILDVGCLPSGNTADSQLSTWASSPKKPNYDAANIMSQSLMRYNQLYSIKLNVIIAGDFSLHAGDIIECSFPDLTNIDSNKPTNKQTTGKYIISSLCHNMTPKSCFTSLTLVRDSFGK
jgi:hypothetical protein